MSLRIPGSLVKLNVMEYVIYRELENRELLLVAKRDTLVDAERLVESLQELWPAVYPIHLHPTEKKVETY